MNKLDDRLLYLQELCNKYGDFRVARTWKNSDGSYGWSKHVSVLACWHTDEGLRFLTKVNNRTSLPCEIFLDIDKENSLQRMHAICDALEYIYHFPYRAYESGSSGHHIHILIKELALQPKWYREQLREFFIRKFDCDVMKKSESAMLALEGVPHWRTGRIKKLLRWYKWKQD